MPVCQGNNVAKMTHCAEDSEKKVAQLFSWLRLLI